MHAVRRTLLAAAVSLASVASLAACGGAAPAPVAPPEPPLVAPPGLDVPYYPTPMEVVDTMLDMAGVKAGDVVYDLGCGDGRIVVRAAQRGARAVGVDLDPVRVREARARVKEAGVEDRAEIREGDLFKVDVSPATVVTLYLWAEVNLRLRPSLLAQLRPGSRIVSYEHDMGDWKPERTVAASKEENIYLWIVPERDAVQPAAR